MTIEKTVKVIITDDEVLNLIVNNSLELKENETWELNASYPYSGEYEFKILKKDEGDNSEEH